MEGRMQRHCLHFVPKCNPREPLRHAASLEYLEFTEKLAELADVPSLPLMSVQERINITFRWVRAHRLRCPLRRRRRTALPATLPRPEMRWGFRQGGSAALEAPRLRRITLGTIVIGRAPTLRKAAAPMALGPTATQSPEA
ncbi:Eif4e1b [Symbiodinium natans]|uniref:Eif4e1b protein n=1 Tax=Symbiodinium natans TaxID=878477 RepID=A0A812V1G0_9DINO|nr:Eif4e1b [Symbiodinium natans]